VDEGSQTLAASEIPNTQHLGQDIPEPARTEKFKTYQQNRKLALNRRGAGAEPGPNPLSQKCTLVFQVPKVLRVLGRTLGARCPDDEIRSIRVQVYFLFTQIHQADAE
jgi:hypothetical protein